MGRSEAEDADGRLPVKDDNKATAHFSRRTLRFFNCGNYKCQNAQAASLFRLGTGGLILIPE